MIQILNLPDKHREYIVACSVLGLEGLTWWYYGSYDTEEKAYGVAEEIGGQVFHRPNYIISTIIDPTADMGMRTEICELVNYCREDGEPVIPCSNHDCPIREKIEEEE